MLVKRRSVRGGIRSLRGLGYRIDSMLYWSHMKEITIYSTPVCHFCNLAKEFFKANNIAYTEYNVATDMEKRKEMIELTGQLGVPVIRVGDELMVGFSEPHMRAVLGMTA